MPLNPRGPRGPWGRRPKTRQVTLVPLRTSFGHLSVTLALELWAPPAAKATAATPITATATIATIAIIRLGPFDDPCIIRLLARLAPTYPVATRLSRDRLA